MEFIIAMALFALIIAAWTMLPGTGAAALTVEETTAWTGTDVTAAAKV